MEVNTFERNDQLQLGSMRISTANARALSSSSDHDTLCKYFSGSALNFLWQAIEQK